MDGLFSEFPDRTREVISVMHNVSNAQSTSIKSTSSTLSLLTTASCNIICTDY
jgi:hypothetical protein